jgi:galactose-1-phosphate uridylyltransferase
MNKSDWFKEKDDAFTAACPLTRRLVYGEGRRNRRYNSRNNEMKYNGAPECYFCPGYEQTQLPEVCRVEGMDGNRRMIILASPEQIDANWVTRVFPNLYKSHGDIGNITMREEWQERYRSEHGERHLRRVRERLEERGVVLEDENYYFDLGHLVVIGTPEHIGESNGNINNHILGAEQSSLELRTAIQARSLVYQDQRVLFGYIYRNLGKK